MSEDKLLRCEHCNNLLEEVFEETVTVSAALILENDRWKPDPNFNYYDHNDGERVTSIRCAFCGMEVTGSQYVWIMEDWDEAEEFLPQFEGI